jgi:hypothetical protein
LVRGYMVVFMDTNSLLRLVYAVATAHYKNEDKPLRRLIDSGRLKILVTQYIVEEAKSRLKKLVTKRSLSDWDLAPSEILKRLQTELDNMIKLEHVIIIDADANPYARYFRAVKQRPRRRIVTRYLDRLISCVKSEACRKNIEKDLPVVAGIAFAYDVAAAVPSSSRAGITKPPFPVVTDDKDLFCSLYKCLHRWKLDRIIILVRYDIFKTMIVTWTSEGVIVEDKDMYNWCLTQHCNKSRSSQS